MNVEKSFKREAARERARFAPKRNAPPSDTHAGGRLAKVTRSKGKRPK